MPDSNLIDIAKNLSQELEVVTFSQPVSFVYDPTNYAMEPFNLYMENFGKSPKKVVLVGMNPGPWGMLQTGVPFGETGFVRNWMGIEGEVAIPEGGHPKRPVEGFDCKRSEVSGRRLWGWAKERFQTADRFFRDFFVLNYCPLAFFDLEGRNITPDKLKAAEKGQLFRLCDAALKQAVDFLTPEFVFGVGLFAFERASVALDGVNVRIGRITHPSPANPAANKGWEELVDREFERMGIELPIKVSG